jgi:hypothetical protein
MNNMGREIMAALKRFQVGSDGDGVTVGGALVVSGATTLTTVSATVVQSDTVSEKTSAAGVTVDGVLLKDSQVTTDQINEKTSAAGVTIDGVLLKDSGVVTGAGTVSAPVYSTTGDTNTGIFFPAADTIAFAEGGAEAMRIDSGGNLQIGTTSGAFNDGAGIFVYNATAARIKLGDSTSGITGNDGLELIYDNDAYVYNRENTNLIFGTNATERMRIDSSGNVLVGTGTNLTYSATVQVASTGKAVSFQTTGVDQALLTRASESSFTNDVQLLTADRSANSAYNLCTMFSGNIGDLEFKFRGDGNGYADGTFNNNGADYAEFFESANGQALTLGATVVLDGNKVREATEQDPASAVIGVVRPKEPSKASMVIGNTAWNKWANKYLTDDFDRYIMEDHDVVKWVDEEGNLHSYESHKIPEGITVPQDATIKTHDENGVKFQHYKLNPAWNPDSEYVNRENRPEWNIIGLLGQVKILKGQPVGDRWVKMRDVSETVEEWFIR